MQANKQVIEKAIQAKKKGSRWCLSSIQSTGCIDLSEAHIPVRAMLEAAANIALGGDPNANVVASDHDILSQYEISADADVVF